MKRFSYFFAGIFLISLFNQCTVQDVYIEPKQIEPDFGAEIVIFKQDFMHNLEVEDSVNFFNSEKIILEKNFHFKDFSVKNGIRHRTDSFLFVKKIIEPLTCGRVTKIVKDDFGDILNVTVSFSPEKGDETYNLKFFAVEREEWFILSGGGATINFRGQSYPLTVRTKGSCILMVIPPERSTIYTKSFSIFRGWLRK